MQNVMFESLVEILALDSEHCQDAALHGLGHLHHPATEQIIQSYLAQHPSLDKNRRDYALAAARFKGAVKDVAPRSELNAHKVIGC